MKKLIFLLLYFLSVNINQAQDLPGKPSQKEVVNGENHIYKLVQKKAKPKEGYQVFFECFLNEFKKPTLPKEIKEIRVKLRFVVEKDGSFSDIQIIEDKFNVGEEAVRVLKTMPKWNPAEHDCELKGTKCKIVCSYFILPVVVKLN